MDGKGRPPMAALGGREGHDTEPGAYQGGSKGAESWASRGEDHHRSGQGCSEVIRAGKYWFASLTTVTPITRNHCRIDVSSAWNLFRYVPFVLPIARHFGMKFIRQDQMTMEQQAEGLKHNPNLMLIDDADRPAKWYFALKQAYQESQRTGAPFKHPIDGPVTLRWRS